MGGRPLGHGDCCPTPLWRVHAGQPRRGPGLATRLSPGAFPLGCAPVAQPSPSAVHPYSSMPIPCRRIGTGAHERGPDRALPRASSDACSGSVGAGCRAIPASLSPCFKARSPRWWSTQARNRLPISLCAARCVSPGHRDTATEGTGLAERRRVREGACGMAGACYAGPQGAIAWACRRATYLARLRVGQTRWP